ncbi:MAG TPA: penicillin-binding transpeptidase domain-containing protein [Oscillospiraceae bacterium]|nr:penicillin-binding transpeptidase domain-containing protein [Oscillospiraceae bacterium]
MSTPTKNMKRRLNVAVTLCLVVFTVWIFINLFQVAITDSQKYQALANRNQFGSIPIHANRGSIYDKNGQILAQSATVFNIILNPRIFQQNFDDKETAKAKAEMLADKLNELFGTDKEKFIEKTGIKGSGEGYQIIAKKVEKPLADQLSAFCEENDIPSSVIYPEQDTKRYYPQGDLAASVIGFLDGDGAGQYGIEAYYDDYLAGVDGRIISAQDALGQEMPYRYEKTYDAENGDSLFLTIDVTLQHYLEKELKNAVSLHEPNNRACGIIMNAKTGAILAMSSVPGFDLNDKSAIYDQKAVALLAAMPQTTEAEKDAYIKQKSVYLEKQWKNKAITELYYPGSVFKVITGSSALEEKVIDLNTRFTCQTMLLPGMSKPFHCWSTRGHGSQNFVQAMTNSCNPAFIQIGLKLGVDKFSDYYKAYGFTEATGIDLPSEVQKSIYYEPEDMGQVELASSSFGQTNKVTPIQMITAYAAVVNGGKLVTPYVVSKVVDNSGNVIKTVEPNIKRQVISEETSKIMRQTLESVVTTNGGSNAYIQGYHIGGKSGTSQKQDENIKQNREDLYVSSYVGFAPADDPEIIMLVMVDEPSKGEYYGSIVAVPVVAAVFKEALPYLGYIPEYTAEELANMDIKLSSYEGMSVEEAKQKIQSADLNVQIVGNGANVVAQVPTRGNSIPHKGTVILYTEENYEEEFAKVPNLMNMTLEQVNYELANRGLNLKATGAAKREGATVTLQNWQEGAVVAKGTIVEVMFAIHDQTG